ncbi:MAG: EFR1 family ferrodoxin [Anaerolineae bacterium]|jgi:NAD-dependent dihydropyrimidine dehydrogenase PreA subunit/flavodoxin|nr:EFR1 family ferrodoxin [Anaerolineae bacterium]
MSTKIAVVYFSGTDVTRLIADRMAETLTNLGCTVKTFDITPHKARLALFPTHAFDGFLFGFPVYADFAPTPVHDWLANLQGQGKRCAQFLTYGARTAGYGHFHTKQLLERAGFEVLFSAEFLGRHTYNVGGWQILPDRPDETDFSVARAFAALAQERFTMEDPPKFQLQRPFGYDQSLKALENQKKPTERRWTQPVRVTETCSMCRLCERDCPTQAFNADTGLSDPAECIGCMRCLYHCPDDVLRINEGMKNAYQDFKAHFQLTEELMQAKQSKIITDPLQAAA